MRRAEDGTGIEEAVNTYVLQMAGKGKPEVLGACSVFKKYGEQFRSGWHLVEWPGKTGALWWGVRGSSARGTGPDEASTHILAYLWVGL